MTWLLFSNFIEIGLNWLYKVKWVQDEQIWSVVPLLKIQKLKEEKFITNVSVVVGRNNKYSIINIVIGFGLLFLRWYQGLRKVEQRYDNYEQERTKNMITWKNVFLLNVYLFVYNSSLNIKFQETKYGNYSK